MDGEFYAVFKLVRNKQGVADRWDFETIRRRMPEPGYFEGERVVLKITGYIPIGAFLNKRNAPPPAFWGEYVRLVSGTDERSTGGAS